MGFNKFIKEKKAKLIKIYFCFDFHIYFNKMCDLLNIFLVWISTFIYKKIKTLSKKNLLESKFQVALFFLIS